MKRLILLAFCLCALLSGAQDKKVHIVELLPNETESVEQLDFYIDQIIDNRVYKDNIGIAQKGAFNRKVLSKFSKSFDQELLDYLETILPKDTTKIALVLRINQLLISENTGAFKETGKAVINLDVLKREGDTYGLLGSFSALREKNSMDVTRKHDDRIRGVLKDVLMEFNTTNWKQAEPTPVSLELAKSPVVLSESVKAGFFTSFLELYNNTPFTNDAMTFKDNRNRPNKLMLADREHKRALFYAYSDGNDIYLNAANYSGEKHFIKTKMIDRFLLFNDSFVHSDDVVGMSMAFGVLGILASNKATNVLLDLYSGQYHVIDRSKIKTLLKENYPDLYKKHRKDPSNVTLTKTILETLFEKEDREKLITILKSR